MPGTIIFYHPSRLPVQNGRGCRAHTVRFVPDCSLGYNASMRAGPTEESAKTVILYVTCGSEEEAETIARSLCEERLIACANIYASRSIYIWKGNLTGEKEHVLFCKTTAAKAIAAEKRVRELHSYDVPCIITLAPERVNYAYEAWVAVSVSGGASAVMSKGTTESAANIGAPEE